VAGTCLLLTCVEFKPVVTKFRVDDQRSQQQIASLAGLDRSIFCFPDPCKVTDEVIDMVKDDLTLVGRVDMLFPCDEPRQLPLFQHLTCAVYNMS
jgi:hypothetical protein